MQQMDELGTVATRMGQEPCVRVIGEWEEPPIELPEEASLPVREPAGQDRPARPRREEGSEISGEMSQDSSADPELPGDAARGQARPVPERFHGMNVTPTTPPVRSLLPPNPVSRFGDHDDTIVHGHPGRRPSRGR